MSARPIKRWPLVYAALISLIYAAFFISYIIISSQIALNFAQSAYDLKQIETFKGVLFGIFSSILLFTASFTLFKRIASDSQELERQREAAAFAERHAVTGLLTMSIAHDCNNLVMILSSAVQRLEMELTAHAHLKEHVDRIESSLKVLREVLTRLHKSGREIAEGQPLTLRLDKVIEEAVELAKSHYSCGASRISLSVEPGVEATGFAILIQQMLINLLVNAFEATAGKGQLKVALWQEAPWAIIEVHDNGPGIPLATRDTLFTPYHSTKKEGLGLGLVSVRACVDSNKGALMVSSSPLGGACFRIKIPLTVS